MIDGRRITRGEIPRIWEIDRSETVERIGRVESGALVLTPSRIEATGWPPGEPERYTPILEDCFDRGGWLYGLFDLDRVVGAAALESRFIGAGDQLQLMWLHVGRAHRGRGLGGRLFELAAREAAERGAKRLYISATPSENTIAFYLGRGCTLASTPDPELLALEPEDIHLECALPLDPEAARRGGPSP